MAIRYYDFDLKYDDNLRLEIRNYYDPDVSQRIEYKSRIQIYLINSSNTVYEDFDIKTDSSSSDFDSYNLNLHFDKIEANSINLLYHEPTGQKFAYSMWEYNTDFIFIDNKNNIQKTYRVFKLHDGQNTSKSCYWSIKACNLTLDNNLYTDEDINIKVDYRAYFSVKSYKSNIIQIGILDSNNRDFLVLRENTGEFGNYNGYYDGSTTITLTEEEKTILRKYYNKAITNTINIGVRLNDSFLCDYTYNTRVTTTYASGATNQENIALVIKSTVTDEATLNIINCEPTLDSVVEDVNPVTLALTGNKDTIVKYMSNAQYAINAGVYKEAEISYQQIKCAGKSSTEPTGVLNGVESNNFLVSLRDSRNQIISKTVEKGYVDYVRLTANMVVNLPTLDGNTAIVISGNYFDGNFGLTNNALAISYRYKADEDESYSGWISETASIEVNSAERNYVCEFVAPIANFDYKKVYVYQAIINDKLIEITTPEYRVKRLPVFDWSGEDFNFNVPVSLNNTATIIHNEDKQELSINNTGSIRFNSNPDADEETIAKQPVITAEGNLEIGGYNVNGLVKAMTTKYELPCEVYFSENYDDTEGDCKVFLIGNTLNIYLKLKRLKEIGSGGIILKEYVCNVTFDSGLKVKDFANVHFTIDNNYSTTDRSMNCFEIANCYVYPDDGSVSDNMVGLATFTVYLTGYDLSSSVKNYVTCEGYFNTPCIIDLNQY